MGKSVGGGVNTRTTILSINSCTHLRMRATWMRDERLRLCARIRFDFDLLNLCYFNTQIIKSWKISHKKYHNQSVKRQQFNSRKFLIFLFQTKSCMSTLCICVAPICLGSFYLTIKKYFISIFVSDNRNVRTFKICALFSSSRLFCILMQ